MGQISGLALQMVRRVERWNLLSCLSCCITAYDSGLALVSIGALMFELMLLVILWQNKELLAQFIIHCCQLLMSIALYLNERGS